jgi:hypothetical protein
MKFTFVSRPSVAVGLSAASSCFLLRSDFPMKCNHLSAQRLHQMRPVAQVRMPCSGQGIVASSRTVPLVPR